jgi:hypothetical protein
MPHKRDFQGLFLEVHLEMLLVKKHILNNSQNKSYFK